MSGYRVWKSELELAGAVTLPQDVTWPPPHSQAEGGSHVGFGT